MSAIATTPSYDPTLAAPPKPVGHATSREKAGQVARQFEAQFISQMFQTMYEGIDTDGLFGGGSGEKMFRSLLIDEYAKLASGRPGGSGFGIAAQVEKVLLRQQEVQ